VSEVNEAMVPPKVEQFDQDNCYLYLIAFHWQLQRGPQAQAGFGNLSFWTPVKIDNIQALNQVTSMCANGLKVADQNGPVIGVVPHVAVINIMELAQPKKKDS